ncbi:hypothetical protein [Nocardia sp. NPDC057030]|uniref:hypothetical protein n=1 Tax=unclassified Nocardia TaxID=2637762 RepID=UPI00362E95C5
MGSIERFYAGPASRKAASDEAALFWQFITAPLDSEREQQVRNQIFLRFTWLIKMAARRYKVVRGATEELSQRSNISMLATIERHTPSTAFIPRVWANFRGVAYRYLLECKYPNLDPATRESIGKIELHMRGLAETGTSLDAANNASAVGLTPKQVIEAQQLIAQGAVDLDAPIAEQSNRPSRLGSHDVAESGSRPTEDTDLLVTVGAMLAGLPEASTATNLVVLCHTEGLSIDEAATNVRIQPGKAKQLLSRASDMLRSPLAGAQEPFIATESAETANGDDDSSMSHTYP